MEYLIIIIIMILIWLFLKSQITKTSILGIMNQSTKSYVNHKKTEINNNVMPFLRGPGTFSIEIVGKSHYQYALNEICGGKTYDGHDKIITAELIHEDDNPFDDKAIRIDINGMTVGHFSRKIAREYRSRIAEAGYPGVTAFCNAKIVGGWKRGKKDEGHYGVRLDLPKG
jgi:hypothetical protein